MKMSSIWRAWVSSYQSEFIATRFDFSSKFWSSKLVSIVLMNYFSKEHLVDRDGLLRYVARKIGVGNVCLVCNENGKAFYSLAAVRQHMLSEYNFQDSKKIDTSVK